MTVHRAGGPFFDDLRVGDVFDTDVPTRPKKSTPLTATGYGVVDEAPAR